MALEHYELAETPEQLHAALGNVADLSQVGVDVERADWDRYWRSAALVQIGGEGRVIMVDPMALTEFEPLHVYLNERLTVLHAMENDLAPIASLGVIPTAIEDTAIAAAILGLPTGLETLLADLLDVQLEGDKAAMQRADWEARPLTEEMLRYAAGDVADLPALWRELEGRLAKAQRLEWYEQERDAAIALPTTYDRRDWTRTKGSGRLDPASRARLRSLWDMREQTARSTDTAPGRILTDKLLLELSTQPPSALNELVRRGMRRQAARDHGEAIMEALASALSLASEPVTRPHRGVTEQDRTIADKLRVRRAEVARELSLDPGVLCPSRTLIAAVVADPQDPLALRELLGLRPWQWELLGHDFCTILELEGPGIPEPRPVTEATDQQDPDEQNRVSATDSASEHDNEMSETDG